MLENEAGPRGAGPPTGLAIGRHRFGAETMSEKTSTGWPATHGHAAEAARRSQPSDAVTVIGGPDFKV